MAVHALRWPSVALADLRWLWLTFHALGEPSMCPSLAFAGTLSNFYHLVEPHFRMLAPMAKGGQAYNVTNWLRRWYGDHSPSLLPFGLRSLSISCAGLRRYGDGAPFSFLTFPYFEIEMAANCWLPDGLLYSTHNARRSPAYSHPQLTASSSAARLGSSHTTS